jgi:hypothetical protein
MADVLIDTSRSVAWRTSPSSFVERWIPERIGNVVLDESPFDTVDSASRSAPRAMEIFIPGPLSSFSLIYHTASAVIGGVYSVESTCLCW